MTMKDKPFIARDTKKPLVVLGGYKIGEDGSIIRDSLPITEGDYGCDPLGNGMYRMVPSGDIVSEEERAKRLR